MIYGCSELWVCLATICVWMFMCEHICIGRTSYVATTCECLGVKIYVSICYIDRVWPDCAEVFSLYVPRLLGYCMCM